MDVKAFRDNQMSKTNGFKVGDLVEANEGIYFYNPALYTVLGTVGMITRFDKYGYARVLFFGTASNEKDEQYSVSPYCLKHADSLT